MLVMKKSQLHIHLTSQIIQTCKFMKQHANTHKLYINLCFGISMITLVLGVFHKMTTVWLIMVCMRRIIGIINNTHAIPFCRSIHFHVLSTYHSLQSNQIAFSSIKSYSNSLGHPCFHFSMWIMRCQIPMQRHL